MEKKKNFAKNIIRSFGLSFNFAKWATVFLIFFTMATYLLPVLQSKILGDIVNSVITTVGDDTKRQVLIGLVILYAAIWSTTQVFSAFKAYVDKIWTYKNEQGFEILFMKKRAEIDLGHYENPTFQNLVNRAFRRGVWPIFELSEFQIVTIGSIGTFLVTSIIATRLSFYVYLLIIITSIPMFVVNLKYGKNMWSMWAENSPRQRKYQHIRQHVMGRTGIIQTKILQASDTLIGMAEDILSSFKNDQSKVDRKNLILSSVSSLIAAVGVGISFYLIILQVSNGKETVGSMVFWIGVLGQLIGSINSIIANVARLYEQNLYVDDMFSVLDTKPFLKLRENVVSVNLEKSPTIEFKDVWFRYDGSDKWILRNINLVIHPGERIAFVGKNGAGKSTLIKLLARIYDPVVGQILIDGVDLRDIDQKEWGSYIAILFQDYVSYDFTVNESIAMGRPDKKIDLDKVKNSAILTDAFEFIDKFESSFDQQLGREFEGGIDLSKGQYQKLAFTRTIYRDGLITILDEPTASIDALSESLIFDQMVKASNGKTLIVISHRFNTTLNLEKIVVLDEGEIIETGNHSALYKIKGMYTSMFDAQAKMFQTEEDVLFESDESES